MSGTIAYVENLSDGELYNELRKRGFSAGPVVASTRRLYKRKLSQILEGVHGGDEQEPVQQDDKMEEELTQPVRVVGSTEKTTFRYDRKPEDPRARTGLSHVRPSPSRSDERLGRSGSSLFDPYYTSQRDQRKDDELRPHSSWNSSHLSTMRGLKNDEDTGKSNPPWLSVDSSVAQPATSSPWKTYGSSTDDPFRKAQSFGIPRHTAFSQVTEESPGYSARQRRTFSDASPVARQEMASRYRLPGYSDGKASVFNRYNPERQRKQSLSLTVRLILFITLVLAAVVLSYMIYNSWSENDPYQQIEQDVMKIIEESKLLDSQE